jgi:hypothetical protein
MNPNFKTPVSSPAKEPSAPRKGVGPVASEESDSPDSPGKHFLPNRTQPLSGKSPQKGVRLPFAVVA